MKTFAYINFILITWLSIHSGYSQIQLRLITESKSNDSIVKAFIPENKFLKPEDLIQYVQNINDSLQKNGYFNAYLKSILKQSDTLYIGQFELGQKTEYIYLSYPEPFILDYARELNIPTKENLLEIKPGALDETIQKLAEFESEEGYPLSSFQVKDIRQEGNQLFGKLEVNRPKKRYINKVKILGYENFPRSFLKHNIKIKQNQEYNEKLINLKFRQLSELPFIDSERGPDVLFEEDSTTVYFYFNKRQANRFDGLLGFGNNQGQDKLRLDGYLDLYLLNNLNYGELLELNYKSDGNDQQTLRVALDLPFLFSTPLGAEAEINLFRRDSTFSTSTQDLNINYQLSPRSKLKIGIQLENSSSLAEESPLSSLETIENYEKTYYKLGYSRTQRGSNSLFPLRNGIDLQVLIGERKAQRTSTSQYAIQERAFYNFKLSNTQSFYLENQTRFLESNSLFSNELFRFGGINSIRGFRENSIYANFYTVFKTEYRYSPAPNLFLHTITDAAYYENDLLNEEGLLYSFGLGAGIITAAGLLNINLSNGLREGQDFQFSNSILHIQLTTTF